MRTAGVSYHWILSLFLNRFATAWNELMFSSFFWFVFCFGSVDFVCESTIIDRRWAKPRCSEQEKWQIRLEFELFTQTHMPNAFAFTFLLALSLYLPPSLNSCQTQTHPIACDCVVARMSTNVRLSKERILWLSAQTFIRCEFGFFSVFHNW